MSPLTEPTNIILRNGWQPMDPDAAAYITAVETADGQALEEKVKIAIDNFVLGCKTDGIWDAIKASCILAGARTLDGALVPLVGTAPTNFNFVAGDYNRKTGLVGDGSTKYLDSNRNNNADPQDSRHLVVYIAESNAIANKFFAGAGGFTTAGNSALLANIDGNYQGRINVGASLGTAPVTATLKTSDVAKSFLGVERSSPAAQTLRVGKTNYTNTTASVTPFNGNTFFYRAGLLYANARLAFCSIGESLDLELLDARVTDLINKFAEVIP